MRDQIIAFGLVLAFILSVTVGMAFALFNSGGGDWKYCKEIMIREGE